MTASPTVSSSATASSTRVAPARPRPIPARDPRVGANELRLIFHEPRADHPDRGVEPQRGEDAAVGAKSGDPCAHLHGGGAPVSGRCGESHRPSWLPAGAPPVTREHDGELPRLGQYLLPRLRRGGSLEDQVKKLTTHSGGFSAFKASQALQLVEFLALPPQTASRRAVRQSDSASSSRHRSCRPACKPAPVSISIASLGTVMSVRSDGSCEARDGGVVASSRATGGLRLAQPAPSAAAGPSLRRYLIMLRQRLVVAAGADPTSTAPW